VLYQKGHFLTKATLMTAAYMRQMSSVFRAHRYDLVYLFREAALLGPAIIESLIARQAVPIVYDFDDAIFVPYRSPSNNYLSYLKCFGKTASLCRRASQVMVGNQHLRDYATQYNSAVTVIPTTIDTDWYRPDARRRADAVPVIGWTGSYSSYQYLERTFPSLIRLARRHRFRLVVVGTKAPNIAGVDVEFRPWRSATEVQDLADLDIGIMPLPDDAWSRGKCGLKALQYMALGIPAVVSPVGVNAKIVDDGRNGFFASNDGEWVHHLSQLIENPTLRERLGRAARITVEERYSARVIAPKVFEIFKKAISLRATRAVQAEPGEAL
jgi:glycosyltransferase involved in cell wall biosynthesis